MENLKQFAKENCKEFFNGDKLVNSTYEQLFPGINVEVRKYFHPSLNHFPWNMNLKCSSPPRWNGVAILSWDLPILWTMSKEKKNLVNTSSKQSPESLGICPHITKTECIKIIYTELNVILMSRNIVTWLNKFPGGRKVEFSRFSPNDPIAWGLFTGAGLRAEEGKGRQPSEHRAATVTCWAVHHIGRHAVGGCLGIHQPRAVVHRLAVGRAGSHKSTLIHAGKTALPVGKESTYLYILTMHNGSTLPW